MLLHVVSPRLPVVSPRRTATVRYDSPRLLTVECCSAVVMLIAPDRTISLFTLPNFLCVCMQIAVLIQHIDGGNVMHPSTGEQVPAL